MIQHIKGNQGMTLVEVLAAFSILSLLLLLVSSIHFFGQKNFMDQTRWVEKQGSVRVAMNQITKVIRSAESVHVSGEILIINGADQYRVTSQGLVLNGQVIFPDLATWKVEKAGNKVLIELTSTAHSSGQAASIATEIYLRQ